ncbi:MAG: chemotaxis protein CheD [Actinobacteria bacterium]|nr:MAG: chemotaxis protein CheD [Actinomycetota bacterium]
MERVVTISDYAVSADPAETLVTYSLGSCLGLALHDPVAGVAGLLHAMMPLSSANKDKAAENPAMYVDTGAQALLQKLFDQGASRANLTAKVAGAASQLDADGLFRIGERNYAVVRKVLWKNGILIAAEDVGGSVSRTLYLDVETGRTLIKSEGTVRDL